MKEPNDWLWPRMYYQEGFHNLVPWPNGRFRILYPDGSAEYASDYIFTDDIPMTPGSSDPTDYFFRKIFKLPCWARRGDTAEETLSRMRAYDGAYFKPAIFMGEIIDE